MMTERLKHCVTIAVALAAIIGLAHCAWAPQRHFDAIDDPLGQQRSRVYDVYGEWAVRGMDLHIASLRLMLETGVKRLAQTDDANRAWRSFISEDDVVALVFNRIGARKLGVNSGVATALLQCLYEAGFKPANLMVVGLDELPSEAAGTRPWRYGWQEQQVDFGSSSDHLAAWLQEATAIINIPSIMDDNIIGLRCALANVTLGVLKSPARLYVSSGDPFIPEVYSLPEIRDKVRLNIAIGLRILCHGGPVVRQPYVDDHKTLLFSRDPVALDRVALELIRRARRLMSLPPGARPEITATYLDTACAMGLGYNDLNLIDYRRIRHEQQR